MSTLSTHVLDIERGMPAAGVAIALYQGSTLLAEARTNADGRVPHLADSAALRPGSYRLVFELAEYFAAQGRTAPFLQRVSLDFHVEGADSHYHVPLLLSPYACTSYRGS